MTPKISALSEIALFAALSESELQGLAQRAVGKRFAPDEMLFWEGEECAGIFLIIQVQREDLSDISRWTGGHDFH